MYQQFLSSAFNLFYNAQTELPHSSNCSYFWAIWKIRRDPIWREAMTLPSEKRAHRVAHIHSRCEAISYNVRVIAGGQGYYYHSAVWFDDDREWMSRRLEPSERANEREKESGGGRALALQWSEWVVGAPSLCFLRQSSLKNLHSHTPKE